MEKKFKVFAAFERGCSWLQLDVRCNYYDDKAKKAVADYLNKIAELNDFGKVTKCNVTGGELMSPSANYDKLKISIYRDCGFNGKVPEEEV